MRLCGQNCCESDDEIDISAEGDIDGIPCSHLPRDWFSHPRPIGRSGGTAAFFLLEYVGPPGPPLQKYGKSKTYWIGKDLSRALDELEFYEKMNSLGPQCQLLHNWAPEYAGVLTATCLLKQGATELEPKPRQLILMRNLNDGFEEMRMLDIKIGSKTAVAGWQGKTWFAAKRNSVIDKLTNSALQGFRLEGFDHPPSVLSSMQEGEGHLPWMKFGKKLRRFHLQRLTAVQFLLYYADFTDLSETHDLVLTPIEYSECVLFDTILQLASLVRDALNMTVPQMWIGSSVGLSCDGKRLPNRQQTLLALASGSRAVARVNIFDWGRSELNTSYEHKLLSSDEAGMRDDYWSVWVCGVTRMLFDALCVYQRQFSVNLVSDVTVQLEVHDYDNYSSMEFIGVASLPLVATDGFITLALEKPEQKCSLCSVEGSSIEVAIRGGPSPHTFSRLSQAWYVQIARVNNLPSMDTLSQSDPTVTVTLLAGANNNGPTAQTIVVYNDNDAEFNHRLDFGQSQPIVLQSLFQRVGNALGQPIGASLLPAMDASQEEATETFMTFFSHVTQFRVD